MSDALNTLMDATTGEVTAKIAALKASTKTIIDAQSRDYTKNLNLLLTIRVSWRFIRLRIVKKSACYCGIFSENTCNDNFSSRFL